MLQSFYCLVILQLADYQKHRKFTSMTQWFKATLILTSQAFIIYAVPDYH